MYLIYYNIIYVYTFDIPLIMMILFFPRDEPG